MRLHEYKRFLSKTPKGKGLAEFSLWMDEKRSIIYRLKIKKMPITLAYKKLTRKEKVALKKVIHETSLNKVFEQERDEFELSLIELYQRRIKYEF